LPVAVLFASIHMHFVLHGNARGIVQPVASFSPCRGWGRSGGCNVCSMAWGELLRGISSCLGLLLLLHGCKLLRTDPRGQLYGLALAPSCQPLPLCLLLCQELLLSHARGHSSWLSLLHPYLLLPRLWRRYTWGKPLGLLLGRWHSRGHPLLLLLGRGYSWSHPLLLLGRSYPRSKPLTLSRRWGWLHHWLPYSRLHLLKLLLWLSLLKLWWRLALELLLLLGRLNLKLLLRWRWLPLKLLLLLLKGNTLLLRRLIKLLLWWGLVDLSLLTLELLWAVVEGEHLAAEEAD